MCAGWSCALLFAVVALNYTDRQVLSVLKPTLQTDLWLERDRLWQCGVLVPGGLRPGLCRVRPGGRPLRRQGRRQHRRHDLDNSRIWRMRWLTSTLGFTWVRIPMGLGESGLFPCTLAATTEWFPKRERALAIGIFNAGSNVGAIIAPFLVPIITLALGWQMAFIITGLLTFVWLAVWLIWYRQPRKMAGLSAAELAYIESDPQEAQRPVAWSKLLSTRQTWAYMLGRFIIDPVWWTFLFWLPDFFSKRYGVDLKHFGPPLVTIYVMADIGSVLGGWRSSRCSREDIASAAPASWRCWPVRSAPYPSRVPCMPPISGWRWR